MAKKEESPLRSEVSPAMIALIVGVVVVLIGGFFIYQNMRRPKFLTGNSGAAVSESLRAKQLHTDEVTGLQTTKD